MENVGFIFGIMGMSMGSMGLVYGILSLSRLIRSSVF